MPDGLEPLTRDTFIVIVTHQNLIGYTDGTGFEVPTFDVVEGGDLYLPHNGEVTQENLVPAEPDRGLRLHLRSRR